ncbi:MAG: lytic transglycosylase domain-containing protein [bacterium]
MSFRPTALFATLLTIAASDQIRAAAPDPADQCDTAAAQAAQQSGVPIDILLAISRVESGRGGAAGSPWPWTINADGRGDWYATKAEAVAAATAHLSDGTATFDVGCFQLNIRWHGAHFNDLSAMFDPVQNAAYAASFLAQLYQESGDWAQAVSAYHSRSPDLAADYLAKVKAVLHGTDAPVAPPPEAVARQNRFPLLQAGGRGSTGSLVPQTAARGPLIGGNS